jgi:radical SAM superfamily enzyme YgiQ (UPF0313 family)
MVTRAGLVANVDLIFGFPEETAADARLTLNMMDRLAAMGARIHSHTFMPLAGTPLAAAPPGTVDRETRNALGRLAGEGKQFGSWARQERLGRDVARFRARRRTC